jgi:hypothetical protein
MLSKLPRFLLKGLFFSYLLALLLALVFGVSTSKVHAAPAHCSPNDIVAATHYSNFIQQGDSFISFAYDIDALNTSADGDPLCYDPTTGRTIGISLIAANDVHNSITEKDTGPSAADTAIYEATIYNDHWASSALTITTASDWVDFYVDVRLNRVGSPGVVEIELYNTVGGIGADRYRPTGFALGHGLINGDTLPTTIPTTDYAPRIRIHWDSGVVLAAGTSNYAVVIKAQAGDTLNYVEWRASQDAGDTLGNNYGSESTDGGVTWAAMDGTDTLPWIKWSGADLLVLNPADVLTTYQWSDNPTSGQRTAALYWPLPLNTGNYAAITDYEIIIWDTSTTQPDAVYPLNLVCLVVRDQPQGGFFLSGLTTFIGIDDVAAINIPILNLLMGSDGDGQNLSFNLGLDIVSAFLLITMAFSFAIMLVIIRFTTNYFVVLLGGIIPVIVMTMQGFIPPMALIATGTFVGLVITWQVLVKQNA